MTREQFKTLYRVARATDSSREFQNGARRASIGAMFGAVYLTDSGGIVRPRAYRLRVAQSAREMGLTNAAREILARGRA
jgi:hypothetical protein